MKKSRFSNGGEAVQVGFLNVDSSQVLAAAGTTTAYAADTVVRISPSGGDTWIAINTNPTAAADTAGSHFIPSGGAQDFGINKLDKINSTAAVCITPFK